MVTGVSENVLKKIICVHTLWFIHICVCWEGVNWTSLLCLCFVFWTPTSLIKILSFDTIWKKKKTCSKYSITAYYDLSSLLWTYLGVYMCGTSYGNCTSSLLLCNVWNWYLNYYKDTCIRSFHFKSDESLFIAVMLFNTVSWSKVGFRFSSPGWMVWMCALQL